MNNKIRFLAMVVLSIGMVFLYKCRKDDEMQPASSNNSGIINPGDDNIKGKYIVIFKDDAFPDFKGILDYEQRRALMFDAVKKYLINKNIPGIFPERVYHTVMKGFAARLNVMQFEMLQKNPEISFIEEDKIISLEPLIISSIDIPRAQTKPYGITRVGTGNGTGKTAWIIDTGIQLTHPDLNVDVPNSKSFLLSGTNSRSPNDENGHGTHVSGTIAAKNNTVGVIGVAANAKVAAVRVLDKNGSGTVSGVINGVDYVASKGKSGDAANMSLGGAVSASLDTAVARASRKGIFFAIAAGNSSANANNYSPARVNGKNIYTVSAMDNNDRWASFSNYGNPPVDFCAPGVNILSTWIGGKYMTISGTSMAAPHAAGVLLLTNGHPNTNGTVKNDPDGNPDPVVHL